MITDDIEARIEAMTPAQRAKLVEFLMEQVTGPLRAQIAQVTAERDVLRARLAAIDKQTEQVAGVVAKANRERDAANDQRDRALAAYNTASAQLGAALLELEQERTVNAQARALAEVVDELRSWLAMHADFGLTVDMRSLYGCYRVAATHLGKEVAERLGRDLPRRLAWALQHLRALQEAEQAAQR
jgi:hypothetical protein